MRVDGLEIFCVVSRVFFERGLVFLFGVFGIFCLCILQLMCGRVEWLISIKFN